MYWEFDFHYIPLFFSTSHKSKPGSISLHVWWVFIEANLGYLGFKQWAQGLETCLLYLIHRVVGKMLWEP